MHHLSIQSGFILLTIGSYAFLFSEIKKAINRSEWPPIRKTKFTMILISSLLGWALFVCIWSVSGRMGNFQNFPFNVMPVFVVPLITILVFTFSPAAKDILPLIPPENIVRIQVFRFFVELLLWALYIENLAPIQMTFE